MNQSGVKTAHHELYQVITSNMNMEKVPEKWKKFITLFFCKTDCKTD